MTSASIVVGMVDGTAGSKGADARDDRGGVVPWSSSDPGRWPVSAVCAVAVLTVLVVLLVMVNVLGLRVFDDGHYDADTGGSVAEWFGAIATLVALPAAVLFGVRQLQSSGDAILLGQRQLEADEAERTERRALELALLRSAVRVTATVGNVVDDAALATDGEVAAVGAWRDEYHQRGWVADADGTAWQREAVRRSNAEQLAAEPGPLLPAPWFVAASCANTGTAPLTVQRWAVIVDGTAVTVASATDLGPGQRIDRRLGPEVGLPASYARRAYAETAAHRVVVLLDVSDTAGRTVRIVHPPPE
jgi:hypothetical protein